MMMQGIRKAGQSLVGKIIVFTLFAFLILSFAVWGIGDIFQGYGRNAVAKVGTAEIGLEQTRTAYQNEVQNLTRQQRRQITPDMARAMGLDRQVLSRLVTESVLDQTAKGMRLAVGDDTIRNLIFDDPVFRNAAGQFDPARFNELLRSNGYTEQAYVNLQRSSILRQQLAEMVAGASTAPVALQEIGNRLRNERRAVTFARVPATAAGEIAAPTDEQLKTYFDERKAAFRAPEYRTANVLTISADTVADPSKVTEQEARARYEEVKGARYGTPERRAIQQMPFPTEEEALAAKAKIDAGQDFGALATERNVSASDLNLGTFTREQVFDAAVREAAFALAENTVSAPVKGAFGPVRRPATPREPARGPPSEPAAAEGRQQTPRTRAAAQIRDLHDRIEDQRAAARPLPEIAKEFGLPLRVAGPVDAQMQKPDGTQEEALPGGAATLQAIFRSDIGVDNEAVRLPQDAGYVWYDVSKIDPSREQSFDEVKARVAEQWRADETASRLSTLTRDLVAKIDGGEAFDAVAAPAGLTIETATDIDRQAQRQDLPQNVVSLIFGTPVGKAASAEDGQGGRILFKVDAATVPPYVRTTQEADSFANLLATSLSEDLLQQYVASRQSDLGVTVNEAAFRNATGGTN